MQSVQTDEIMMRFTLIDFGLFHSIFLCCLLMAQMFKLKVFYAKMLF